MINEKDILERLLPLLKIDSVKSAPEDGAPFGVGPRDALLYVLDLAEKLGFETRNYDNYVGEVIFGSGKPFGVLCHLDVVPVGSLSAWNTPPFEPTIKDGKLYCRGAVDDKSAAISVLSALFELKQRGYSPKREIRLILGCDEESGWGCIEHYRQCATLPEDGFSPDADFPVIYAEKGILHIRYAFDKLRPFRLEGGVKTNVVCDYAEAEGDFKDVAYKNNRAEIGKDKIVCHGKTAHGSTPDKGDNALKYLTDILDKNGFVRSGLCDDLFGNCQGAKELSDETGCLTFSPNIASTDDKKVYYTVDVRYPATLERSVVEESLKKIGEYEVLSYQPPLFVDKESFLVKTLTSVYNGVVGKNEKPIAIGGGTYARALKNGVAFGPCIGEEGETVHMPNEYITLSTLNAMTEIYYQALYKLCVE